MTQQQLQQIQTQFVIYQLQTDRNRINIYLFIYSFFS